MRKLLFVLLLVGVIWLPAKGQTTTLAALNMQVGWTDGTHCDCSVTFLLKGVNGAPDTMVFSGRNSDGHITGNVPLNPLSSYQITLESHDQNVTLADFIFTSALLTSQPITKLNFTLKYSKANPPALAKGSTMGIGI